MDEREEAGKLLRSKYVRDPVFLFRQINEYLGDRDTRPTPWRGVNSYIVRVSPQAVAVTFHGTKLVTVHWDGSLVLNTDGWGFWQNGRPPSVTTKRRMNDVLECVGLHVYQTRDLWYIDIGPDTPPFPLADGLHLRKDSLDRWNVSAK